MSFGQLTTLNLEHRVELTDETLLPSQQLKRRVLAVFTTFWPQKVAVKKLNVGGERREEEKRKLKEAMPLQIRCIFAVAVKGGYFLSKNYVAAAAP